MTDLALLPANATPLEIAVSRVGAARRPLPADLIKAVWNPATCPVDLLPILANQLSVDVWDPAWDETKKRRVIAAAIVDQKGKGTLATLRSYAAYRDAEIVRVTRPPERFFVGGTTTPAEHGAWIASLPQIRLYTTPAQIPARPRVVLGGATPYFLARRYLYPTSAPERGGDRAVLHHAGVEIPLGRGEWSGGDRVTISVQGRRGAGTWIGGSLGRFLVPSTAAEKVYAIALDATAETTPIWPGGRVQTTRPEIVSERAAMIRGLYVGACLHRRFLRPSTAARRIWRMIPIIDGTASARPRRSTAFLSATRFLVAPHTAELAVSIPGHSSRVGTFLAVRSLGRFLLPSIAAERIRPTLSALSAGARLTDTLLIDTNVHRPLTAGSPIFAGQSYFAGQWTRR